MVVITSSLESDIYAATGLPTIVVALEGDTFITWCGYQPGKREDFVGGDLGQLRCYWKGGR